MKQKIYDKDRGSIVGEIEIPDDVLAAAHRLYSWLSEQPSTVILCGVTLADD